MTFEMPNFLLLAPEIFLLSMACVVLLVDLFLQDKDRIFTFVLAQVALIGTAIITMVDLAGTSQTTFNGMFIRDNMGDILKISTYLISAAAFVYSRDYLKDRNLFKGEFFTLGLFAVLGMGIMISAASFLTIYMGLELLSLCLYALVAFNRDSQHSSEAAMKYFVLGAMASGMLLYGMSMLYGATGSLEIFEVAQAINAFDGNPVVLVSGMIFIIVGLSFKLGIVPFHMWLPDVYHGAPTPVTLFLSSAPKLAAFAITIRLLAQAMAGLSAEWIEVLTILVVLSIGIGNVVAIAQTNIKRMLAYSTISHVGFLLLGIISGTNAGYSAAMFYAVTYALMSLGAFGIVILLCRKGFEAENINDFKGLNDRNRWYAAMMAILMFSLAGVPPTVGFYSKLLVLKAVISVDMVWLAITAVLFSVIGAFYYLRVIKVMYFDKPDCDEPLHYSTDMHIVLSANGLAVLALGLFPGALIALCSVVL